MRYTSRGYFYVYLLAAVLIAGLAVPAAAQSQNQNPIQSLKNVWNKNPQPQQQPAKGQPNSPQAKPGQAAAQGSVNDKGPFTPPPGTKIDPVVMAPIEQGAAFAVSPHGVHVATVSHAGSRVLIIYDGVPGPKFDQLFLQDGAHGVVFSPDGITGHIAAPREQSGWSCATGRNSCAGTERRMAW